MLALRLATANAAVLGFGGAVSYALSLSAASGTVTTSSYSGSPEGLFTSAIAPKWLFDGTGILKQQSQLFTTISDTSTIAMPEVSVIGGAPGHGFTCTGLAPEGLNYIIGCDGGVTDTVPSSSGAGYTCGLVKMSPAGVNLGEINIRSLFGLAQTATVQGVDVDKTDGSYWVACGANGVKHVSAASWTAPASLAGSFAPASGNANGLCIDSLRDRIIVMAAVPVGQAQFDIYNRADQAFISTTTMGPNGVGGGASTFDAPDHLYYDAARDYIWVTAGSNGVSGKLWAYKAADLTLVGSATLTQATTIEGLIIQNGQFVIASDGYYHGASGGNGFNQLQFYPAVLGFANVAWPLDYDPVSHALLGYRMEPAYTRQTLDPNSPANASWTKTNVTATNNSAASPTGNTDAAKIQATASTGVHEALKAASTTNAAGAKVIASDILKIGTQRYVWSGDRTDAVIHSATFDLQAGTVVGSSNCTATIKDLGNGWYRCTRAYTNTNAVANTASLAFPSGSTHAIDRPSLTAAGTENFYCFDHEIAVGEYSTSAVFGSAAANEVRAADTATLATSALGLSATANTFFAQGRTARGIGATTSQVMFQLDDGSENNRIRLVRDTSKHLRFIVTVAGAQQCNLDLGVVADETDFKVAIRCKASDFSASLNGAVVVTAASGALPAVTTFRPGMSFTGEQWAGWVKVFQIKTSGDADAALIASST